jgi:ankyrin repeat protein
MDYDDANPTALIIAVENRHIEIVELLLQYGADVHAVEYVGYGEEMTALKYSYKYNYSEIVELLLQYGAAELHYDAAD